MRKMRRLFIGGFVLMAAVTAGGTVSAENSMEEELFSVELISEIPDENGSFDEEVDRSEEIDQPEEADQSEDVDQSEEIEQSEDIEKLEELLPEYFDLSDGLTEEELLTSDEEIPVVGVSDQEIVASYRLYNPYSGEHLYSQDANERRVLLEGVWLDEGISWYTPSSGSEPVYRVYNPLTGEHHYTMDANEVYYLTTIDIWNNEGIAWFSDPNLGRPVYRLFNAGNPSIASHHYTASAFERDVLISDYGWLYEGIAWFGVNLDGTTVDPIPVPETTPTPVPTATPTPAPTATSVPTPVYHYEVYGLGDIGDGYYTYCTYPLYIKTDNPIDEVFNINVKLVDEDGNDTPFSSYPDWSDISYTDQEDFWLNNKVEGGKIFNFSVFTPGNYYLRIEEMENDQEREYYADFRLVADVPIEVKDVYEAEDEWIDRIIAENTTDTMTPFEKMDAIEKYFIEDSGFTYLLNDGKSLVYLAGGVHWPLYQEKRWDSYVSPGYLCKFAERIGGFDDIHNCYGDPDYDWYIYHSMARLTIGDEERFYSVCPPSNTGYIDSYPMIDFNHTEEMSRIY